MGIETADEAIARTLAPPSRARQLAPLECVMMQNVRRDLSIRGRRLSYLDAGDAAGRKVAVLLHAFPLHAGMWAPQLAAVPAGWRFVAPDLPGLGATDPRTERGSIEDYARDVVDLIDALAADGAVVGGVSMGGYVAFGLLRIARERVAALLLADTRATADTEQARQNRLKMIELVEREGVTAVAGEMAPKLLGETTRRERPEVERRVRELAAQNSPEGVKTAIRHLMTRPDSVSLLAAIEVPTLVVVGSEDSLTPVADSEAMARQIPGARLEIIPGAGHLSNLERPDEFNALLLAFLAAL